MFAMIETRPDIAFATSVVSRHAKNPGKTHMEAAKHILRYLSGTKNRGITFGGGDYLYKDILTLTGPETKSSENPPRFMCSC